MAPDHLIPLDGGRRLAVDDRGASDGTPVLYLHGTPDSRLARHPDDHLASEAGVRLLAPDRPGIGDSDADPTSTPMTVARDVVAMLDHLDIDSIGVLSWSAGSIFALAVAGAMPERVDRIVLASPLIPADGYETPGVLDGSGDGRRFFAEALPSMTPDELGRELAMWLVPPEIDESTAREVLRESLAGVEDIPGAGDRLVQSLVAVTRSGMSGLEREVTAQAVVLGPVLDQIACPVTVHVGTADEITPPPMADWFASRLGADVTRHDGATHSLALVLWQRLLTEAAGR